MGAGASWLLPANRGRGVYAWYQPINSSIFGQSAAQKIVRPSPGESTCRCASPPLRALSPVLHCLGCVENVQELCCRCASPHHGLGLRPAEYEDVARSSCTHTRAPLLSQVCGRARSGQGRAFGGANAPSFDHFCARRFSLDRGSGRGNGLPGRTRKGVRRTDPLGRPLTRNAPYKQSSRISKTTSADAKEALTVPGCPCRR